MLAGRSGSFLLLDETHDILEHGGGTTGKFAVKYGPCLVQYLASPEVGAGPVRCQASPAEEQRAAAELLPMLPSSITVLQSSDTLAPSLRTLGGSWYGVLEPSGDVVSFAIVDAGGTGLRAVFGYVSGWRRGGLYEFTAGEGGLTFRLGERGTITVKNATLTWTPASGTSSQAAKLLPVP